MMVIAEVLVLVFALLIAIVRGLPGRGAKPLRGLAIAYTDFFRGLQKDTAIIGAIGVTEAAAQANNFASDYFNYTGFLVGAVFFIFLTIPLARYTDHLIRRRELRERAAMV